MMSVPPTANPPFQYRYLPEGIHELTLLEPTRDSLDQCFARLDTIFAETRPGQTILLLSDIRQSGIPPVGLLASYARRLLDKYPDHSLACDAVVHNQEGSLFRAFSTVMGRLAGLYRARVRFFRGDGYDQAVMWLLAQRQR